MLLRFNFCRDAKYSHNQEVSFEILDAGPNVDPRLRYLCVAKANDEKTATGNPDSSIEFALENIHWIHLD